MEKPAYGLQKYTPWTDKTLTVIPIKPWTPEKISEMFFVSWPIRYQMKTCKLQHGLDTTWHETTRWLFLPWKIFNFIIFKYWNCTFPILVSVEAKNRYKQYWMERTVLDEARQACLRAEKLYSLINFFSVSTVLWIIQVMISEI